jgi:hypothetical protein
MDNSKIGPEPKAPPCCETNYKPKCRKSSPMAVSPTLGEP